MSAAEGLKAAVRQRLEGVLVEVLGLIQTTMEKYESELKQSREEVERLTGPRTLRLRTEMTELTELTSESENERNEIYIVTSIKKEQPERPTARKSFPHNQNHENPTSNHNLKSEDSEEECPICRSLDQERNDSALINAEDSPASIQPQETEKTAVKSEEEERGLSDTNKPHQDLNEQEKREEGRHLPTASQDKTNGRISSTNSETTGGSSLENDLAMNKANINATTQKDPIISDGQKDAEKSSGGNSAEKALSSLEGKSSEGNDGLVGARKMDGTCRDQERLKEGSNSQKAVKRKATDQDQEIALKSRKDCSKSVDCEKVATEREYQKEANLVVHSSLSNSAEKGLSTREEIGKSRSLDPKSHGSKSLNVEDRVQDMVRNLPTVRLIPLEFFNKTQRSKVQLKKPTSSNTKLSQKQDGVQNSESSQKSKITKMKDKSKTVAGRSSDFLKSPTQSSSSKKPAQKEHGKKCSDDLLRKEQKQKKALNAEQARVGLVGSSVTNHSQYKSQESGKSKVDGVSQTTQMPTVLQSSPVTKEHKAKSLKLNSNRGTNSPLEKTGKEIDHSCKAGETSQNVSDRGASVTNGTIKDLAKSVQKTQLKSKAEHECSQCGTIFRLKGNLLKHLVMHQEERPFECSQCGSRFKRKTTLKEHMSIHSDEKQFKCSVCPRTYTRKSNLSDHMKTHLEHARPFSCYMCSRAFTCRSNLRRHIIAHSGLRPFRCDMCGKSFGRKSILQDHVRSHTREKHFKCLICNMKFTTKTIHQRHTRLHDNKRKFRCTVCTAAFNQNGHLRQHMLRHTGEKPYRCSVCEKTFTRKAYLKTHCQKYCHRPAHPVDLSDKQEPEAAH